MGITAPPVPAQEKGTFLFKKGNPMGTAEAINGTAAMQAPAAGKAPPPVAAPPVKAAPVKRVSKLKAIDPKSTEPSKPKILIFGKPGVKKTWISLDFPKCYYIDTEGGAELDAYTDKLKKSGGVYFGPEQGSSDFSTVIDEVKTLATERHEFKTLIIDSKSKIFNNEIAKEMERLGDKDAFGASKKLAVSYTRRLIYWLDKLDMTVILICHERPLWANDKQIGVTYDGYDKLEYELHLCLNIVKEGNTSKAYIKKSRLPGFLDAAGFEWSYEEFAKRYGKEVLEQNAKPIVLATPEQLAEVKRLLEIVKLSDTDRQDKWLTENAATLADVETEKLEKIINHLKGKVAQ